MLARMKERALTWFREHRTIVIDVLVTVLICVVILLSDASLFEGDGLLFYWSGNISKLWSVMLALPLALRRTRPRVSAWWFVAVVVVQLVFGPPFVIGDMLSLPMFYSAIVYDSPKRTNQYVIAAGVLAVAAALVISFGDAYGPLLSSHEPSGTSFWANTLIASVTFLLILLTTLIAAFWQRARRQTIQLLNERNDAIVAREQEEKLIAASAERARIARDMHDIVAHTLSIIIIQSDGGRYAATHDATLARSTMVTIQHEAEHAMHDMKRLLGVFGGSPHADYHDISALINQATSVSTDMSLRRETVGTPQPNRLSEQASIAMYHVVQEALTNIRKYAGHNVNVVVREEWTDTDVTFTISDDGRGASAALDGHKAGYGLMGMSERITAVHGTVDAGPRLNGGFEVKASVPLTASASLPAAAYSPSSSQTSDASPVSAPAQSAATLQSPDTAVTLAGSHPSNTGSPSDRVASAVQDDAASHAESTGSTGDMGASAPSSDSATRVFWPSFLRLGKILRSRPIAQVHQSGPSNWVARLSHWTEHHYVLTDTIIVAIIFALLASTDAMQLVLLGQSAQNNYLIDVIVTLMLMGPLCLRRRFPRAVAIIFASVVFAQLLFLSPCYMADLAAPFIAYAAMLYGKRGTWKWLTPLIVVDGLFLGLKVMLLSAGYPSTWYWLTHDEPAYTQQLSSGAGIEFAIIAITLCIMGMFFGAWVKTSGSNPQVLQARTEALRAEQEKARVNAANRERDRISANIRSEVNDTLSSVIDETTQEIATIDAQVAAGEEPSPEWISEAFGAIGTQGRTALKHMRQLLSVLRETGFSDKNDGEQASGELNLTPAKSLNEQMTSMEHSQSANATH